MRDKIIKPHMSMVGLLIGSIIYAGLLGGTLALAQTPVPKLPTQTLNAVPTNCDVPAADLEPPDLPPDTSRVIRIVTINNRFVPDLSTGTLAEIRAAKVSVEPRRRGYNWGKRCRGRVKYYFLSEPDTAAPAPAPGSGVGGPTSSAGPSTGSSTGPSAPGNASVLPGTSAPDLEAPVTAGSASGAPCDPPAGSAPKKIALSELRFLVQRCELIADIAVSPTGIVPGSGRCLRWGPITPSFVPVEEDTVGLILPGGERIQWGRDVAEGARFENFTYPADGDETPRPELKMAAFPNGVSIQETAPHQYRALVPAQVITPRTSSSSSVVTERKTATGSSEPGAAPPGQAGFVPPVPVILLNGSAQFKHQWFVDDAQEFVVSVRNGGSTASPAGAGAECSASADMMVEITVKTLRPFFDGLVTQSFVLAPQTEKSLTATLKKLLDSLSSFESDILFGARIEIRTWPVGQPDKVLQERAFNVYRFLDVADDEHVDAMVEMARTLADGKGGVARLRTLDMQVHPDAAVLFVSSNAQEFQVQEQAGVSAFRFDPKKRDNRALLAGRLDILTKKEKMKVGSLRFKGVAELRNRVVFDSAKLSLALAQIVTLAQDPLSAQDNPPNSLVHPALVPAPEWQVFDDAAKRLALAADIKRQMDFLWQEAGLLPGIEWSSAIDSVNTVDFEFELRSNQEGFELGVTGVNADGLGATDNLAGIQEIIAGRDQWNKAELAFRLSRAINPGYRQTIKLWPDSILESVPPSPHNRVALSHVQMVNAFAKTMVHEIGHSWSLHHPSKPFFVPAVDELQKIVLKDVPPSSTETFTLSFHGQTSAPLSFYLDDPASTTTPRARIRTSGLPLWTALTNLSSIGLQNYAGTGRLGVFVYRCADLLKLNAPTADAQKRARLINEITICLAEPAALVDRTMLVLFAHHLGGADVDALQIHPAGAGTVTSLREGQKTTEVATKERPNGVIARAVLDGYGQDLLFSDVMQSGGVDAGGLLRFESGISLEPFRMALALNYTAADVDKVVKLFAAMFAAYERWGTDGFQ